MYFILLIGLIGLSPTEYSIDFEMLSRVPLSYQVRRLLVKNLTLYKNTLQFYLKLSQSSYELQLTYITASLCASNMCLLKKFPRGSSRSDYYWIFDRYWVARMVFSKTGWLMTALATGGDQTLNLHRCVLLWASIWFGQVLFVLLKAFNPPDGLLEYLLHEQLVFLGLIYFIFFLWLKRNYSLFFNEHCCLPPHAHVVDKKPLDVIASSSVLRQMHHLNSFCSRNGNSCTAAYGTDTLWINQPHYPISKGFNNENPCSVCFYAFLFYWVVLTAREYWCHFRFCQ